MLICQGKYTVMTLCRRKPEEPDVAGRATSRSFAVHTSVPAHRYSRKPARAVFEFAASPRGELGGVPRARYPPGVLWERKCVDFPARSGPLAAGLEPSSDSLARRVALQWGETLDGIKLERPRAVHIPDLRI
jgi:hypothetical protein